MQGFSKITAQFILILKTTELTDVSGLEVGNGNGDIGGGGKEFTKKSEKSKS